VKQFIAKFGDKINGVLSGFDRLVLQGKLRALYNPGEGGMERYLKNMHVLMKDYGEFVQQVSRRVREASLAAALDLGCVVQHVAPSADKAEVAQQLALEQRVRSGMVCVLTSVEPCWSFRTVPDRVRQQLNLKGERRQCLHIYHYWIDPEFGFMSASLQTWFPFRIQVCLNGREWLARQMERAGLAYVRQGNCFPWIADFAAAQKLMEKQVQTRWLPVLASISQRLNPIHGEIFRRYQANYSWTTLSSEWAVDIRFEHPEDLQRLYPLLIQHGMTTFGSADILRFLGQKVTLSGQVPLHCAREVESSMKQRKEGTRIKHSVDGNSVKAYDKAYMPVGNTLRLEATINRVRAFNTFRPKEGEPQGPKAWRVMRRSVEALPNRAAISGQIVERYADALASLNDGTRLEELVQTLEQAAVYKGQRVRGLRLFGEDNALLAIISRAEFNLHGFRNRDLQGHLYATPAEAKAEARRRSAAVGRKLRLLRAHGLIEKVGPTHRYLLTETGRITLTAILSAQKATVAALAQAA